MTTIVRAAMLRALFPAVLALAVGCGGGDEADDPDQSETGVTDTGADETPSTGDTGAIDDTGSLDDTGPSDDTGSGGDTGATGDGSGDDGSSGDGASDTGMSSDGATDTGGGEGGGDAEAVGITVTPTSGLTTTEAGGTATFTVKLNAKPTDTVTIGLSSSKPTEGTAAPTSLTFTVDNWSSPQTVTVTGVDDTIVDGSQAYKILTAPAVSADTRYSGLDAADVDVTNLDDDKAGIIVDPVKGLVTTEAGGTAKFTVRLGSKPTGDVTIALSSSKPGEGLPTPTSLKFTTDNYASPQTVTVTGVDDTIADGDQKYFIVTAPAVSTDATYSGLDGADVEVTNVDNDSSGITVTPTSGLVTSESGLTATFSVVLNTKPTANVTIALTSSNTAEGTVDVPSLTFTPLNWDAPQIVTVRGVDDMIADGTQPYTIVTAAAVSTDTSYNGIDPSDVSVSNLDNDFPGFTVSHASGLVTTEGGGTDSFAVRLNTRPSADVTIALSSSRPGEAVPLVSSITFTAANWDVNQLVIVKGVDDTVHDGDQPFVIRLAPAVSTDLGYNGKDPIDVTGTNIDNDTASITVSPATTALTPLVTNEAGTLTPSFTITLNSAPTAPVTITVHSSKPAEGLVSWNGSSFGASVDVVFTMSDWMNPHPVTLKGADDAIADGDQQYTIITDAPVTTDTAYSALNPDDVFAKNLDNDTPGINATVSSVTTTEGGAATTFGVTLNSQPLGTVTLNVTSSNTAEGTVSPATLTFNSTNWNDATAHQVTVTPVDDTIVDGPISYTITLAVDTTASSSDYASVANKVISATNNDNDVPSIVTSVSTIYTSEAGNVATFGVTLGAQPTSNVTVTVTPDTLGEAKFSDGSTSKTLTFCPTTTCSGGTAWNVAQTVSIKGQDDSAYETSTATTDDDAIPFKVNLSSTGSGTAYSATTFVQGYNYDDEDLADDGVTVIKVYIDVEPTTGLATSERGLSDSFNVSFSRAPMPGTSVSLAVSIPSGSQKEVSFTQCTNGAGAYPCTSPTYTATTAALTHDNWDVGVDVTVYGLSDGSQSAAAGSTTTDDAFTIVTGAVTTSTDLRFNLDPSDVTGINYDWSSYVIIAKPTSGKGQVRTKEDGSTDTFRLFTTIPSSADISVPLTISKPAVAGFPAASMASTMTATIPSGSSVTITVAGKGDGTNAGRKFTKYNIVTGTVTTTDPNYTGQNPNDVAGRNQKVIGF